MDYALFIVAKRTSTHRNLILSSLCTVSLMTSNSKKETQFNFREVAKTTSLNWFLILFIFLWPSCICIYFFSVWSFLSLHTLCRLLFILWDQAWNSIPQGSTPWFYQRELNIASFIPLLYLALIPSQLHQTVLHYLLICLLLITDWFVWVGAILYSSLLSPESDSAWYMVGA